MKFTGEYLRELADKREKLVNEARGFYEKMTESEKGSDAASQARESYDKLRVDLDKMDSEFREAQAWVAEQNEQRELEARNRDFQAAIDRGLSVTGNRDPEPRSVDNTPDPDAPIPTATGSADPAEDEAYRQAYFMKLRDFACRHAAKQGLDIPNPTPMTTEHRNVLERYEKRALATLDAAKDKGSNTVPQTFTSELIEFMKFAGPLVPDGGLCAQFETETGADYHMMTVDDTGTDGETMLEKNRAIVGTDTGGTHAFKVLDDAKFNRVTFQSHVYDSGIIPLTYEMLIDTQVADLEGLLGELGGKRVGRKINTDFTGELTTAVTKKVTTAIKTAWTSDEIMQLPHKIDPSYRGVGRSGSNQNRLQIMFNDTIYQTVRLMKTPTTGTIAQGLAATPYLTENGRDIMDGDADRLLGRYPIWLNQNMKSIGDGNDVMVMGDFNNARIRKVAGPFTRFSEEYYWAKYLLAMVVLQRCDFKVVNANTFVKLSIKS